jgi:hypothetical protein
LWEGIEMILYDCSDEFDTLLKNGMFRNREPVDLAQPISGSTADTCRYDADEVEEVCRICGLTAMRVEVR